MLYEWVLARDCPSSSPSRFLFAIPDLPLEIKTNDGRRADIGYDLSAVLKELSLARSDETLGGL